MEFLVALLSAIALIAGVILLLLFVGAFVVIAGSLSKISDAFNLSLVIITAVQGLPRILRASIR